jgi:hypothetical protein
MRILLDEDVPVKLRHAFPSSFVVETVTYRGGDGLDNGALWEQAQQENECCVETASNRGEKAPARPRRRGKRADVTAQDVSPRSRAAGRQAGGAAFLFCAQSVLRPIRVAPNEHAV